MRVRPLVGRGGPQRVEAVLLDFDGTLADTVPLIVASYRYALAEPGMASPDEATIRSWIGRALRETLEQVRPGRGEELVARYREHNLAHHDELIAAVPGAGELVGDLLRAGVPVGVVSSKRAELVRHGMDLTGVPRVEVVIGLEETARHKPHPEPLLLGADALGVDPARCVYVGDAVVDVRAARAAGMSAIAVSWGAGTRIELEGEEPDALVDDVAQLRALLVAD